MATTRSRTVDVAPELIERTLDCYFPHVRYLTEARVEYSTDGEPIATEIGDCHAIAHCSLVSRPPWYIRDTGHFNAIEFNICYNQMAFVLLAQCVESGAVEPLCRHLPKEEFSARMLPDVVIHRYSVIFDRPMSSPVFRACLGISRVLDKMGRLFLDTQCRVAAPDGPWCSRGEIKLAIVRTGVTRTTGRDNLNVARLQGEKIAS